MLQHSFRTIRNISHPPLSQGSPYTAISRSTTSRIFSYGLATSAHRAQAVPVRLVSFGRGRPPKAPPTYPDRAPTLKEHALDAGAATAQKVIWRTGTPTNPDNPTAQMSGLFLALRMRPGGRGTPSDEHGILPERWLLIEWPSDASEPTDYWLSDLPADPPTTTLVRLAKIRSCIEHDCREPKTGLGLDLFEGRTFTG